jgi:hypothetical protein
MYRFSWFLSVLLPISHWVFPTPMNIPPILLPWSIGLRSTMVIKAIELAVGVNSIELGLLGWIIWVLNSCKLHLVHTATGRPKSARRTKGCRQREEGGDTPFLATRVFTPLFKSHKQRIMAVSRDPSTPNVMNWFRRIN